MRGTIKWVPEGKLSIYLYITYKSRASTYYEPSCGHRTVVMFGSRLCQIWQKYRSSIGKKQNKVSATADLLFWNGKNIEFKIWPNITHVHSLRACHVHTVHRTVTKLCTCITLTWNNYHTKFHTQQSFRLGIAKIHSCAKKRPKMPNLMTS